MEEGDDWMFLVGAIVEWWDEKKKWVEDVVVVVVVDDDDGDVDDDIDDGFVFVVFVLHCVAMEWNELSCVLLQWVDYDVGFLEIDVQRSVGVLDMRLHFLHFFVLFWYCLRNTAVTVETLMCCLYSGVRNGQLARSQKI